MLRELPSSRIYVFLGASGSGKSELAVNLALELTAAGRKTRFFDMDQTKPSFRSRDVAARMRALGVSFDAERQMLDARTVPSGVSGWLADESTTVVFDVGGNAFGATMLGQYAEELDRRGACVLLLINPYRSFSGTSAHVVANIRSILSAARTEHGTVVANPNFGAATSADDVVAGHFALASMLEDTPWRISVTAVSRPLVDAVGRALPGVALSPIDRHIVAPWEAAA